MNEHSGGELSTPAARRRIVVGFDGSHEAEHALEWAISNARSDPAVIEVVAAWTFPMVPGYAFCHSVPEVEKAAAGEVGVALTHVAEIAPEVVVRGQTVDGSPGPALVAASEGADLLVVGSRGRGGITSTLLGSVSAYCARNAPCSVVIVR